MVERVHLVGHFAFPSFPYGSRAVLDHISPTGIFGIFENFNRRILIPELAENVEQVSVPDVSASRMIIPRDNVFNDVFRDSRPVFFGGYSEGKRHCVFGLRTAGVRMGFLVIIFGVNRLFNLFRSRGVKLLVLFLARNEGNFRHKFKVPVKGKSGNEKIVRFHSEAGRIYPVGVIRVRHYAVFSLGKQKIYPLFKVRIFRLYDRIVAVKRIAVKGHHKIDHANGVGGSAARIERRSVAYLSAFKLSVGYICGELREKRRHIAVVNGLIKSCTEVVEPAETLVSLRTIGQNGMLVVMLRSHGDFVQIIEFFVGTCEFSDYFRICVNVFRDYLFNRRFARNLYFDVLKAVVGEPRHISFYALAFKNILVRRFRAS